jgi:retron-type reverse transcriptase
MIRYGNLFSQIASFENLLLASRKARRGKRLKQDVMRFEAEVEEELCRLQQGLLSKDYVPGAYREFTLWERKRRKISAAPYRDRVIQQALCNVIEPIFEKNFIFDSYACRRNKGTHRAVERFSRFCRQNQYVLKADILQYFASIDHAILLEKIARKVKCPDTLWLVGVIIEGSNPQERRIQYFPGDDLFTPWERRRGIPIGNLTSQFFANCYLNDLDHFLKEELGCRHYLRYVDDLAVFGNDKKQLWQIERKIEDFLAGERLRLHPGKSYVAPMAMGIDHLGYRIFPSHRRLRRDSVVAFWRKVGGLHRQWQAGSIPWQRLNTSLDGWRGHACHGDTYGLRRKIAEELALPLGAGL